LSDLGRVVGVRNEAAFVNAVKLFSSSPPPMTPTPKMTTPTPMTPTPTTTTPTPMAK
jgi:hypothetical protein